MKNLSVLAAIFAVMLFASCASTDTAESDAVKQSEIYQAYTVTYDAGDKELSASACFRFGGNTGTTLHLTKPSKVSFDGQEMALENDMFSGTYYSFNEQAGFKARYEFVFADTEKKEYTNAVSFTSITVTDYPKEADKSTGLMVKWDNPITDNERVYLYIEDNKGVKAFTSTEVVGATSIELSSDDMKDLYPGGANIYLTRESDASLKDATHLGGKCYTNYISEKFGINLTGDAPEQAKK